MKKDNDDQLDLFGYDLDDKKKSLEEITKKKNAEHHKLKEHQEKLNKIEWEKDLEKLNKFLSWGRCSKNRIGHADDGRSYFYDHYEITASINKEESVKNAHFKLIWELPLFEELFGTVIKKHLKYELRKDLESNISEYENVIDDCINICKDCYLAGYGPLLTFSNSANEDMDISIVEVLEKQSISIKNNIIYIDWEFKTLFKNQEIYDVHFDKDVLRQCIQWSGW